ncbi:hypothetical protein [Peijinzhouia sedimentorum]
MINALLKSFLAAIIVGLLLFAFGLAAIFSLLLALIVGLGVAFRFRVFHSNQQKVLAIVHQDVPDLEYSSALLYKPQLNLAEQLQMERLGNRISQIQFPNYAFQQLMPFVIGLLVSVSFYALADYILPANNLGISTQRIAPIVDNEPKNYLPQFQHATVTVSPPAYTGLVEEERQDLNVRAIVNSELSWEVSFSNADSLSVFLVNNKNQKIAFQKKGDVYRREDNVISSGLYNIRAFHADSLIYSSDQYRIEAIPDLAPKIEPSSKELFSNYTEKDGAEYSVKAQVSDDFLVSEVYLVATLARGSGENVRFRETRLSFDRKNFQSAQMEKKLDLKSMDFNKGDELYYFWVAVDNQRPEPNISRSDTYFLIYKDSTELAEAELATMAINVLPDYFRSQRQIIIDTEKLIADKESLEKQEFNSTSNEIGYDQKVLRLRYGQYLGEEFESTAGNGEPIPEGASLEALLSGFVHDHDGGEKEDNHTGEQEEGNAIEELHDHGGLETGEEEDPMAALMSSYLHDHDSGEKNTYFEQSTRSLLKMALEEMWQSELHMRLYHPEDALPYQQRALEYLKTAQQRARVYVKRIGYDPPPIKEDEKRLTGKLEDINKEFDKNLSFEPALFQTRLAQVNGLLEKENLNRAELNTFQELGLLWSEWMLQSELDDWKYLSSIQKIATNEALTQTEKLMLKKRISSLLLNPSGLDGSFITNQKLEEAFRKRLKDGI